MSMITLIITTIIVVSCVEGFSFPCTSCEIQHDIPAGHKACYYIKSTMKMVPGREVRSCVNESVCKDSNSFGLRTCTIEEVCRLTKPKDVAIEVCRLEITKAGVHEIPLSEEGQSGTIYQINTPRYFSKSSYNDNSFCVFNLSAEGAVNYRVIHQQLEVPNIASTSLDRKCPDVMEVSMGNNQMKLCGKGEPQIDYQRSPKGLVVTFCSDSSVTERGALIMAYKPKPRNDSVLPMNKVQRKRQTSSGSMASCEDRMAVMSSNMSRMGCQYEYMMRMAQPGVECPSDDIILNLIHYDNYMMTDFSQDMDMCDGMDEMTDDMPMMNQVESCAVNYLYRTRDRQFAQKLLATSNGELRDVAQMIVDKRFPIRRLRNP